MNRLRSWLQYRAEKRMLERNPYDYVRWVLGMPDATDAELDEAAGRMADGLRSTGFSAAELTAASLAFSEAIRNTDSPSIRA